MRNLMPRRATAFLIALIVSQAGLAHAERRKPSPPSVDTGTMICEGEFRVCVAAIDDAPQDPTKLMQACKNSRDSCLWHARHKR
jgi:hypothetical protein